MQRVRITVKHNHNDPADDLRFAARVRRDLWTHSPIEVDPDSPRHGTHRDEHKNAFFEFATDRFQEVRRVLHEFGYEGRADAEILKEDGDMECVNCGNVAPKPTTVCPNCSFRNIEPCPHCNSEVPQTEYIPISGNLFKCPVCQKKVRLQNQDPLFDGQGYYVQPSVLVLPAEDRA